MAGSCESCKEHPGSVKCGVFFEEVPVRFSAPRS